jgi:hypothetical protein
VIHVTPILSNGSFSFQRVARLRCESRAPYSTSLLTLSLLKQTLLISAPRTTAIAAKKTFRVLPSDMVQDPSPRTNQGQIQKACLLIILENKICY